MTPWVADGGEDTASKSGQQRLGVLPFPPAPVNDPNARVSGCVRRGLLGLCQCGQTKEPQLGARPPLPTFVGLWLVLQLSFSALQGLGSDEVTG